MRAVLGSRVKASEITSKPSVIVKERSPELTDTSREPREASGAMVMRARELWGGRPARKMRDLDDAAIAGMRMGVAHYAENARHHAAAVDAATQR